MDATNVQQFDFELVSPERKLMSEKAWQVTIPGEMGNFGVRAGHSSLVSAIRPGVVEIVENEGDAPTKIFIAGGFADVTAMNCTILAEQAINITLLFHGRTVVNDNGDRWFFQKYRGYKNE